MIQQDPGALYPDHLAVLCRRAEQALARGGFDHLVVPSGTLHYQVFDDRDYPYAVNPQFKAWLPLTRVPNSWIVFTPGKRPAVIWRKLSFGTQSERGSRFVETMLSVIETCRQQKRDVFRFVTAAVEAHFARRPAPLLLAGV